MNKPMSTADRLLSEGYMVRESDYDVNGEPLVKVMTMKIKSYSFEVGGTRPKPGGISRYKLVEGTTQELSMIDAYRKVMGDHATVLCRGDAYCKIVDPDGETVTVITQRREW